MFNKELEMAKEIEVASLYTELNISAATRLVSEQYKKAHNSTDQSMRNEHEQLFNDIIPPGIDIDNGQVYDKLTGNTIKGLV